MAKVILAKEIKSISGKVGNTIFRTFNRPNGQVETRIYRAPKYARSTPPTAEEQNRRTLFAKSVAAINALSDEQRAFYKKEATKNKLKFNGKQYKTLRGYILARLYDNFKNQS